jgi:hypothetical protein
MTYLLEFRMVKGYIKHLFLIVAGAAERNVQGVYLDH